MNPAFVFVSDHALERLFQRVIYLPPATEAARSQMRAAIAEAVAAYCSAHGLEVLLGSEARFTLHLELEYQGGRYLADACVQMANRPVVATVVRPVRDPSKRPRRRKDRR